MTPLIELGEVLLSDSREGGRDYLLRPSFSAMMNIGTPAEIVATFAEIHSDSATLLIDPARTLQNVSPWALPVLARQRERLLMTCARVMDACCEDDLTPMVGEWLADDDGIHRYTGELETSQIIIIARHLMQHGIIGKAKVRQLQRNETGATAKEFHAFEYISAARHHFGLDKRQAAELTMTEFILLLNQKYPPEKGLTRDEYDAVADDFLKKQALRRKAAEGAKK